MYNANNGQNLNLAFPNLSGFGTVGPQTLTGVGDLTLHGLGSYVPNVNAKPGWGSRMVDEMGGWGGVAQTGIGAVNTIGNLWGAYQANKMAKKQFAFTKDMAETNLSNQIQSYNTALSDRARSRAVTEGQSDATRDQYVADNSLRRRQG